jgi:hypothetical protein
MSGRPWAVVDCEALDHIKFDGVSDAAVHLWLRALLYCRKHLTDGFVPEGKIKVFAASLTSVKKPGFVVAELVERGLWRVAPGGWKMHDYSAWQQTRDEVAHKNEGAAERMRRRRAGEAKPRPAADVPPPRGQLESGVFDRATGESVPAEGVGASTGVETPAKLGRNSDETPAKLAANSGQTRTKLEGAEAKNKARDPDVTREHSPNPSRERAIDPKDRDREREKKEIQSPPLPPAVPAESSAGARGPGGGGGSPVEGSKPVGPAPGHGGAVPAQTAAGRPGAYPPAGEGRHGAPTADPPPLLAESLGPSAAAILGALEACPALAEIARPALAQQLAAHVDGGSKRLSWVLAAVAKAGKTAATDNATDQPMPARTLGRFVEGAVARCGDPAQTAAAKPGGAAPWRPGGGAPYHAPPKTKMSA